MSEIDTEAAMSAANRSFTQQEQREAAEFVLRLGNALLQAGYPINQIGEVLLALSHSLALPQPQVYVTPTVIEVTIGPLTHQHRALLVTTPGDINLGQLTQLDAIARAVAGGTLTPRDGIAQLETLSGAPPLHSALLVGISYAFTAAAFARTLGGGIREMLVAALVGGVTGVLAVFSQLFARVQRIFPPLAAFVVSLLVTAWAVKVTPVAGDLVTLAGLFVLLPGFTLTVALEELASRDLVSGTVRLTSALITLLGLILGVALGRQLAERLFGPVSTVAPQPLPAWTYLLAALVAGLAYTLWLQVERRDVIWVVVACVIGSLAARVGVVVLGPQLGAFAAALVVGLASNLFALVTGRPAAVMQVPGLIVLVPGSIGLQSFQALFTAQTIVGIQTVFQMFLTAIALVYGIFVANLLLPSRNPLRALFDAVNRFEQTVLLRGGRSRRRRK
ncbi:MAG TPA: threonine/serine exporter family protein [Ktedonobacterales bacterium]